MITSITIVLIRILAAYCLFWAIMSGVLYFDVLHQPHSAPVENPASGWFAVLFFFVMAVGAIVLWVAARLVARGVIVGIPDSQDGMTVDGAVAAGSFLIGLYYVIDSLPNTILMMMGASRSTLPYLFGAWAPIILGLLVMIGAPALMHLFRWLRRAG